MSKQLTVQQLIEELQKFNPNAVVINNDFKDTLEPNFRWFYGDYKDNKDINEEKMTSTYISLNLIKK